MSALENAKKLEKEKVLEKIAALDLMEAGIYREKLSDHLEKAKIQSEETQKELEIAVALNNADTDYVLLSLLKEHPKNVMEGMEIVACAMGAKKKTLYVPEKEAELAEILKDTASEYGIDICTGIVNIRANKGNVLLHIATAYEVCEAFEHTEDYQDGIYVSVNGEAVKKVACDTKICDLADTSGAKALLLGYQYHAPEDAELTVSEADIANGVVRILTEKECIVNETEKRLLSSRAQSCGKCVFCREGLIQLEYMQKEITEGRGKADYLELTKEIGEAMCYSTPCSMGQVSSKIALTAVEGFAGEYEAHIKKKKCPAGVCASFVNIYIDPKKCTGCEECADVCPKNCIEGKAKYIHMIDDFDCIKCGKCIEACQENAIIQTTDRVPKLPTRLTKVGRFKRR